MLGRKGGGHRLRPRDLDRPDGKGLPGVDLPGFDYHDASIDRATEIAREEGVAENTEFAVASAKDLPGEGYDLVCFFDCLHDMGDPVGAMTHVRKVLDHNGSVMLVEPFANDALPDTLNPVGRIFYAASTLICTPSSLDQEVGLALGAQAGESGSATSRARPVQSLPEGDRDAVQPDSRGAAVAAPIRSRARGRSRR